MYSAKILTYRAFLILVTDLTLNIIVIISKIVDFKKQIYSDVVK